MSHMRPHVTAIGNVTSDPELRFTSNGHAFLTFGVAINNRKRLPDGSWEDTDPEFHDVVAWRDLAENAAESIAKGQRVVIVGQLSVRKWQTDDGSTRSKTEIVADDIAPSVRFAVVKTEKVGRRETRPAEPRPAPTVPYDEEPF